MGRRRGASPWSFSQAASGSGSPELIPEDALRGDADFAQNREMAIRAEAILVALAQVEAEAQEWTGTEQGACESIVLREREEARTMLAHVLEQLRVAHETRLQEFQLEATFAPMA